MFIIFLLGYIRVCWWGFRVCYDHRVLRYVSLSQYLTRVELLFLILSVCLILCVPSNCTISVSHKSCLFLEKVEIPSLHFHHIIVILRNDNLHNRQCVYCTTEFDVANYYVEEIGIDSNLSILLFCLLIISLIKSVWRCQATWDCVWDQNFVFFYRIFVLDKREEDCKKNGP